MTPKQPIKRTPPRFGAAHRRVRRRKWHRVLFTAAVAALLVQLQGCDRPPRYVYILQAPQTVELLASASASNVKAGARFVLHARRTVQGAWQRIESKDLQPDQCWMAVIPPTSEPEVADNLHWRVEPSAAVSFNTDFRPNRTREVSIASPGTYTFTASYGPWCEAGRSVTAPAVTVTVEPP